MGVGGKDGEQGNCSFPLSSYYVPDMVLSTYLRNMMCLFLDMLSLRDFVLPGWAYHTINWKCVSGAGV